MIILRLNKSELKNRESWESAGISLPGFNIDEMEKKTLDAPVWLHFGGGNIFRGFIASLQDNLLEQGFADKGIITAETFDGEIVEKIYNAFDNLTLDVRLFADGHTDCSVISSVAKALDAGKTQDRAYLNKVFENPALQMVSFTITEKGYALTQRDGSYMDVVKSDMENGPENPSHAMSITAAGMYARYNAGACPIALVSMDNCSQNGKKLMDSVLAIAQAWEDKGLVKSGFVRYLKDESLVSFPWTMIDKITPRPAKSVEDMLNKLGISGMETVVTSKQTYIAPFVNAENPQYLVIEDRFPNGRPALEKSGVYMTDRDTVEKTERMKVTTCLNPLHTAMSIFGCLLGCSSISGEMEDTEITGLIDRLGYTEGLPVVVDPKVLSPRAFLDEVIKERLPNPYIPDTPQRIVTDTSQKVGIRFGETVKSWQDKSMNLDELTAIPLSIAGWFRYLLGVDDKGNTMEVSSDPLKDELQKELSGISWDSPASYSGQLKNILKQESVFGLDLTRTVLGGKIETYFIEMLQGKDAVRNTLKNALK